MHRKPNNSPPVHAGSESEQLTSDPLPGDSPRSTTFTSATTVDNQSSDCLIYCGQANDGGGWKDMGCSRTNQS